MRADVPVPISGLLLFVATAIVAVGFWALALPDAKPARHIPVLIGEPRDFSGCFESVVPRMQFYCEDGSIWTRTVDGSFRIDRPSAMPRIPAE